MMELGKDLNIFEKYRNNGDLIENVFNCLV